MKSNVVYASFLFFLSCLTIPLYSLAQYHRISLEINYPIPVGGNNSIQYESVISTGLEYSYLPDSKMVFNSSLNYIRSNITFLGFINSYADVYDFTISVSREINLDPTLTLYPVAGGGYFRVFFKDEGVEKESTYGLSTKFGLQLNKKIGKSFSIGIVSYYKYHWLSPLNKTLNVAHSRDLQFVHLGLTTMVYF